MKPYASLWTALALAVPGTAVAQEPAGSSSAGAALYAAQGCSECHGGAAQGGAAGPRLAPPVLPYADFLAQLRQPRDQMPPYAGKVLSDRQVADIHAYLRTIAEPPPLASLPLLK
jgi:mono/diheme cytochrome c family protein